MPELIIDTTMKSHEYRMYRARLSAETATARYSGEASKASARDRQLFLDSIKYCNTEFKEDANRQKACLDGVIPIKGEQHADVKLPAPKDKPKVAAKSGVKPTAKDK